MRQPMIPSMTRLSCGTIRCQINGTCVPVAEFELAAGDWIYFSPKVLLWTDPATTLTIPQPSRGRNPGLMEAHGPGHIGVAENRAGEVIALPLRRAQPVCVRPGPSLAAQATGSPDLLWGGLVIFLLCGTAAAFVLRGISSRTAMLVGCLFLLAGTAVTYGAIATTTSAAFLAGAAVAGVGLGLAFLGAFRVIIALATPGQRAGLVAAIFTVLYLVFSVPALIAGVATTTIGLHSTALVYSASLAALAAAAAGILVSRPGGTPPGQPQPQVPSRYRARVLRRRALRPWTERTVTRQRPSSPPVSPKLRPVG